MLGAGGRVQYLFGDSTESKLDFDYLAFLREAIDCAVVMLECEVALAATVERRRVRQTETDAVVSAIDELGRRATQLVVPVAQGQADTPVGRCAASVATAIKEAVERETSRVRGILAGEHDEQDQEDQRIRARTKDALERLLRAHDLPGADKELEVVWTGSSVKASMRERTSFGVEAVIALEVPPGSVLVPDLRVDRVSDGVEVHTREGGGGWLKKSDKLVTHKLGRYLLAGVTVGTQVTVRLRAAADAGAAGFTFTAHGDGELNIEPTGGGPARELAIDDRARPALRLFADKLEAAVRSLEDHRGGLVSIEIDGKPVAEHGHPRVLAERFMLEIAPTVHRLARHSRSPGELVLRRLLGDNRREEIFISVAELVQRYQGLPAHMQDVFAPLQLGGEAPPAQEPKQPSAPVPEEVRSPPSRTSPPVPAPDKPRPVVPAPDPRRASHPLLPSAPAGTSQPAGSSMFEDDEPTVMKPIAVPTTPPPPPLVTPPGVARAADKPPEVAGEQLLRKPADDSALGRAIDAALDGDEETPPAK